MIAISLPLPPSANRIWRSRGQRRPYLDTAYRAWKQEADTFVRAARVEPIRGPFDIHIFVPADMRGDADNRVKPILDFCKGRLTDDDKHAQDVRVTRAASVPAGTCTIKITNSTTADDAGVVRQGAGLALAPKSQEARRGVSP